jgi:predicted RNase H-like HicB family nuclease
MRTIQALVERASDGTYSVYCIDEMFHGMGNTPEEAKANMLEQIKLYIITCIQEGLALPDFLNSDYSSVYKYDTESLLQYYAGVITPTALERLTGIHRKQLWSYMHGRSKPRKAQKEKIEAALHELGNELSSLSFFPFSGSATRNSASLHLPVSVLKHQ